MGEEEETTNGCSVIVRVERRLQGVTGRSRVTTATCWAEAERRRGWGKRLACTAWADLACVRKLERPRVKRAHWGAVRSTRTSSSSTMAERSSVLMADLARGATGR